MATLEDLLGIVGRRILSRVAASGYISRFTFRSLTDVLHSDECRTKKSFQYVERKLPLFRAAVKSFKVEACVAQKNLNRTVEKI